MMGIFSFVGDILAPVLAGFAIAFVMNIPLRGVERLYIKLFTNRRRGLRRAVSVFLCYIGLFALVALLVGIIIPQIVNTAKEIIGNTSTYIETAESWYGKISALLADFSVTLPEIDLSSENIVATLTALLDQYSDAIVGTSVNILSSTFSVVFDAVMALALSIYVLAEKERLGSLGRKIIYSIFSEKSADRVLTFTRLTSKTFSNFVTGQLTEAVIIAVLCFVGMLIFRIPYAPLISVIVGVTALIPIFGAFIGTGIGAFLILFESPLKAIIFVVFIIVLQQIEGNVIYPKVVGSQVGLPGLWVLIAVTIGSEFGIVGMLVSVPVASLIYALIHQLVDARLEQKGLLAQFAEEEEPKKKKKMKKPNWLKRKKKGKEEPEVAENAENAQAESEMPADQQEQNEQ